MDRLEIYPSDTAYKAAAWAGEPEQDGWLEMQEE